MKKHEKFYTIKLSSDWLALSRLLLLHICYWSAHRLLFALAGPCPRKQRSKQAHTAKVRQTDDGRFDGVALLRWRLADRALRVTM